MAPIDVVFDRVVEVAPSAGKNVRSTSSESGPIYLSLCKSDRISKAGFRFTGSWYIIRDGQCIGIWIVFEPATNNRTLSELRFYEVMLILFPDWSCPPLQ